MNLYNELIDGCIYADLTEALYTTCPLCGDKLEWDIKLIVDNKFDEVVPYAKSSSCGLQFEIRTTSLLPYFCQTVIVEDPRL